VNELKKAGRHTANPRTIAKSFFKDDLSLSDYEKFVRKANAQNEAFYKTLRSELVLCLTSKQRGNFSESFLYLYRILEYISFAIPLMYSTSQSNFKNGFIFIKSLVEAEKDGHLVILKRSVPTIFKVNNIGGIDAEFSITGRNAAWVAEVRNQFDKRIKASVAGFEFDDTGGSTLFRVPFNSVPALIINVRNRAFHYRMDEPNIDLGALGGIDGICEMLMPELTYWLAVLFGEMLYIMASSQ
jgi:hypothetical protein